MSIPISPDQLEWYDQAVYVSGQVIISSVIVYGCISLFEFIQGIHRRYKIGKEMELAQEAEEAKGVN